MHAPPHPASGTNRSWALLILLCAAEFMVALDLTVANVALPSIGRDLHVAAGDLPWVLTAYILATGGLMLVAGRLADLVGRRRVLLAGIALFTGASLASGLAPSFAVLIAARAAQGVGAALLLPTALSILTTAYDGERRTAALAAWGAIASSGAAVGLLAGGLLTDALSWEWIFLVNVPLGAAAAALVPRLLARDPEPVRLPLARLDLPGALALIAGLVAVLLAISEADERGWGAPLVLAGLAGGVGLLGAFALFERSGAQPLVPPSVWRLRSLVAGTGVMVGATGIVAGSFFLNSLYLQDALGYTALESGLGFLPIALAVLAAAHVASHLITRLGSRTVLAVGLATMAGGALLLATIPDQAAYVADLLPGYLLIGLGAGLGFVGISVGAMADVGDHGAGAASGLLTTGHELGAAIGVAVLAAIATAGGDAAGLADGFRTGYAVATGVGAALTAVALLVVPSARPAQGAAHAALH